MPRASLDAAHCRRIVTTHARTFALASWFLPAEKQRAAYALYAFCRVADDIVDDGKLPSALDEKTPAEALACMAARLDAALAGEAEDPVFRELAWAAGRFRVPRGVLLELLRGVGRDLHPERFATWADLRRYCEGVASSVGEMCVHVFGVTEPASLAHAIRYARALGVAMQLTNILRDVGEDARRGRCYFPDDELAGYGLSRDDVIAGAHAGGLAADARWIAFAQFQAWRARQWYHCALPGISLLADDARRCALACALGYAKILGAVERNGFDSFTRRASLGALERGRVLWQVAAG